MPDCTESFVAVRGTNVRVLRAGDGPPLLYLHGSGDRGDWLPVHDALAARFDVIRPDHPGFGWSGDDDRIHSVHDLAYFYLDLLDELGVDEVSVVGSSLGGWIAADLATIEPRRIARLVLVGSAGLRVEGSGQPDEFVLDAAQTAELLFHDPARREASVDAFAALEDDPDAMERYLRNRITTAHLAWNPYFHDPQLVHRLHRIAAPALLVWGREDGLVPAEHGRRWAEFVPDARLELVEDCGHLPHVERCDRFLELVEPFLAGSPVAA